jgi:hypothetical protein
MAKIYLKGVFEYTYEYEVNEKIFSLDDAKDYFEQFKDMIQGDLMEDFDFCINEELISLEVVDYRRDDENCIGMWGKFIGNFNKTLFIDKLKRVDKDSEGNNLYISENNPERTVFKFKPLSEKELSDLGLS